MKQFFCTVITAFFLCAVMTPANSMDFSVRVIKDDVIAFMASGEIALGDTDRFIKFVSVRCRNLGDTCKTKATILLLNSGGGNVYEATQFAKTIRAAKVATLVYKGDECASACFMLFAAGVERAVSQGAMVGVHSAVNSVVGEETFNSTAATVLMSRFLSSLGVPSSIIGKVVETPPEKIYRLTTADFRAMAVDILDENFEISTPAAPAIPKLAKLKTGEQPRSPVSSSAATAIICGRLVDYTIEDDNSDNPMNSNLIGIWTGTWNSTSKLCGGLIVERIDENNRVNMIYVYGLPSKNVWKQQAVRGRVVDGKIWFTDDQGGKFTFLAATTTSTTLSGEFVGQSGELQTTFTKY